MARMTPWVRQYALRDLLDSSIDLFKQRAGTLLLAGLIPYAFVIAYMAVMRLFFSPGNFEPVEATPLAYYNALLANPELIYYNVGFFIISLLAIAVGYTAQCRIAVNHTLLQETTLGQSYRRMFIPLLSLLLIGILYSILLGCFAGVSSMAAGIIIGIITLLLMNVGPAGETVVGVFSIIIISLAMLLSTGAASTYLLAAPVIVAVEKTGPFDAIGRSFNTASSNFRTHFTALMVLQHIPIIIIVLLAMIAGIIQYLLNMLAPITVMAMVSVVSWVGMIIVLSLLSCLQALVYLDGRCRREKFDLLLLGEEIGIGREVAAALSSSAPVSSLHMVTPAGTLFPDYSVVTMRAAITPPQQSNNAAQPVDYSSPPSPAVDNNDIAAVPEEKADE